jgi:hypothetical protein
MDGDEPKSIKSLVFDYNISLSNKIKMKIGYSNPIYSPFTFISQTSHSPAP